MACKEAFDFLFGELLPMPSDLSKEERQLVYDAMDMMEEDLEKLKKIEQLYNDWKDDYIDDSTFIEEIREVFRNDR